MAKEKKYSEKEYKVILSKSALQNIDEITGYIAFIKEQPGNAIIVADAIFDTIQRISLHPFAFRECEELPTKDKIYRRAVCQSWLIIYIIKGHEILILGVMHKSQKPSTIRKILRNK